MDNTKICVIIPVHKSIPNYFETISLKQCRNIFSNYSAYLVFPKETDVSLYHEIFPELILKPVDRQWLDSIEAYNKMKHSLDFYELFTDFDFMLTYELDAYIFSDKWDAANCFYYDYIGAPWFEDFANNRNYKFYGVGNSGFSMRNIQTCIAVLKEMQKVKRLTEILTKLRLNKIISFSSLFRLSNKIWRAKANNLDLGLAYSNHIINEDYYWGIVIPKLFNFKIAEISDSIKFSFEVHPSFLYKQNNYQMPLGCHAWEKYEPEFWAKFINNKFDS